MSRFEFKLPDIGEGVTEGEEVVSGGSLAINRDLEDGKKIVKGSAGGKDIQSMMDGR